MKKVSMIRKYYNHTLQTNPRHREEELQDTRNWQEDKQSKATSSLFPVKMIVKLEMAHSNVQKTWNKHRAPQLEQQSTANQEQQNRRLRTTNPFLVICRKSNIVIN